MLKISNGKYVFREGKKGDRPASGWADQKEMPVFVLEYDGKQVGAAHGSYCYVILIEVFDENKGHCTKFIELWEKYVPTKGCSKLVVDQVSNAKLEHILKDKRGFCIDKIDEYGEKTFCKDIP